MASTAFQATDTQRSVGRPPLNVEETKVRLTKGTCRRIEAFVGENRMAAFIRDAVERELEKREAEARGSD